MITKEMIEAAAKAIGRTATDLDDEGCKESCDTDGGTCICVELHWEQARAALTAALSSQWRGMESAPKDGTTVLVYRPDEGDGGFAAHAGIDYWNKGTWWHSRRDQQPTHWMPLPPPPATQEGEK